MKILIKLLVLVVVLILLAVGVGLYSIDALAKAAVERGGTAALGVETTVAAADIGILGGTFSLNRVRVANPAGFEGDHLLTVDDGNVAVTLGSLREDTVRLPTLNLTGLDVNLERRADKANYDVVLENLKRFESKDPAASRDDGKKFIIESIVIRRVNVSVNLLPIGGSLTRANVPIEEIRLENVGSDSDGGLLLAEVTSIVMKAIFASVLKFGGDVLPAEFLQDLGRNLLQLENLGSMGIDVLAGAQGQLQNITSKIGAPVQELQRGAEDAAKGVQEVIDGAAKGAEGVLKGIGDLIGGGKKGDG